MITGAAGLIRAIETTISAEETRSILINSAKNVITPADPITSSPSGLLNLNSAIQSSLIADGVGLATADGIYLSKGRTQNVQIDVTVPASSTPAIDVGFVIDQSGSYEDDIATLQTLAQDIVQSLRSRTDIDVQFGVAGFADFPKGDYGDEGDVPYRLYQDITGDSDALIAAIDKLNKPLMNGDDYPESQYEALFRAAREIGWRDGTLRILLLATDADFHDSDTDSSYPGAGRRTVLATLAEENIIVIGLQSGDRYDVTEHLQELADATGGSVLSLDWASSQVVDAITRGLDIVLADVDVTLDVLAGQSWVTGVDPTVHEDVRGGQTVSFMVSLTGQRDSSIEDLPYNVYIWARGDGAALLSRTKIPILVPRESAE
ncbi:MAG: VWA domain-containing protein [Gemmatimonadetes bacterium]|nr:VWA domain-containing protein [Candidatus Poribacteria bacterium]MXY81011.1 VWA domain-containing protein [Gemmatimonadota bacterium]